MARTRNAVVDASPVPKTRRLNAQVRCDEYARLFHHCIEYKKSPGELISDLIAEGLREFRVQRNPTTRIAANHRAESAVEARESVA